MDSVSVRRQLAALLLSLLVLVAFSGSVLADCIMPPADMPDTDCHEVMESDCSHHAAESACLDALECLDAGPVLVPGERSEPDDHKPDAGPPAAATGPPPTQDRIDTSPVLSSRLSDSRQLYLNTCRFLE